MLGKVSTALSYLGFSETGRQMQEAYLRGEKHVYFSDAALKEQVTQMIPLGGDYDAAGANYTPGQLKIGTDVVIIVNYSTPIFSGHGSLAIFDPIAQLLHEMFHGWQAMTGDLAPISFTYQGQYLKEWEAIYFVNLWRMSAGRELRTHYHTKYTEKGRETYRGLGYLYRGATGYGAYFLDSNGEPYLPSEVINMIYEGKSKK